MLRDMRAKPGRHGRRNETPSHGRRTGVRLHSRTHLARKWRYQRGQVRVVVAKGEGSAMVSNRSRAKQRRRTCNTSHSTPNSASLDQRTVGP